MPWPLRKFEHLWDPRQQKSLVFLALLAELRCTLFRVPEKLVGQWQFWNAGE
jgi:hypothetical protein